ncbi:hypothetical protein [Amycolatopsis taiwanensis]|nr:hypothetical protein [Amycolatopsis taiwanensis]
MRFFAPLAVSGLLAAGTVSPAAAATTFTNAIFQATHNSYSGNLDAQRGSIRYQLDHGIRFIELDIQDNDYSTVGDYRIGHNSAGDLVDHSGGNPSSNLLRDWLAQVAAWSNANPTHAPLVVMLDIKDNLTDNANYAAGNLAALNDELRAAFGGSLMEARNYVTGSTVDSMRGKVVTLLSGDSTTRAGYQRDLGYHPAIAMNNNGQIVEVHDSGAGALWYWTGTYGADGRVNWLRHGRYDSGTTPAVALNDNGDLVEVHQSQSATTLWYHVGHLGADGEISFSASHQYDNGVAPSIAFTGTSTLREVHRSPSTGLNWQWTGSLSTTGQTVAWTNNARTSDQRYPTSTASAGGHQVTVYTQADGATPSQTLRDSTDQVTGQRIAYRQRAFVEYQDGDNAELRQGALFYAAPASDTAFLTAARANGFLARGWQFDSAGDATNPLVNYPATDYPYQSWYQSLLSQSGAVQ